MFWNIVIAVLSYALQLVLTPKPPNAKAASIDDFQAPTAEEGVEIPVLFGTRVLKAPNVTWYGDLRVSDITGARRYGLFGPRQVIGHRYSLGMHMGLCHGPADKLYEIRVGDKTAWSGISSGGRITINKSNLFGGDQSEGGISGDIDLDMGAPTQGKNDYLVAALGAGVPAFRGIVGAVLRRVYLGTTPYIKPWDFTLQRILLKSDGTEQWYSAKAAVPAQQISSTEPGKELAHGDVMGGESLLDTNGDFAAWGSGGSVKVWQMPGGELQTLTLEGHVTAGSLHITDFAELAVRSGGNIFGTADTSLEFRDVTNTDTILQSINLNAMVEGSGATDTNFGFQMDDIAVSGTNYALVAVGSSTGTPPYIILSRGGSSWSVSSYHARSTSAPLSLSMGPTYAYAKIASSPHVLRLTWNGTWAESAITLPGYSGSNVRAVHYHEGTGEVVVIDSSGGMFVYDEALSTLLRSSTGNGTFLGIPTNSKRMSMGSSIVVAKATATNGPISHLYVVQVSDLSILDDIVVADTSYVRKGSHFDFMLYNQDHGTLFMGGHFQYTVFWPITALAYDMNPAHIIRECLTDRLWGMGYNAGDIDDQSFTAAADTFYGEGFGLSLPWVKEAQIEEFVQLVQSHVDAYVYVSRSTGKWLIKPIRSDYDIDTIPVLAEDDVVEWTEISRRQPAEATNTVIVKYYDRDNRKDASHAVSNIAQIQQEGDRLSTTREYPGICIRDLAVRVGTRDVISLGVGMISGNIICKRTIEGLNPGDPFRLVSARHELAGEVMRVVDLKFGDGRSNKITLQFVQDVFNLGADVLVDTTPTDWVNPASDPAPASPRLAWEMPYRELRQMVGDSDLATMLATDPDAGLIQAAGTRPSTDAIQMILDVDPGGGFTDVDTMAFAPGGVIDGDLAIDATSVGIALAQDIDSVVVGSLAVIGGSEVVRIDAVAGTTLTIARGCLDTIPVAHEAGADIVFFDDFSMSDFDVYTVAAAVQVKLLTRTGVGTLSLSGAPTDVVTMDSRAIRPLRPADVQVETIGYGPIDGAALSDFDVTWANRNRLTELSPVPAWTDADETPETDQTTIIEILDPTGTSVVTTHSGLTGTSFTVPLASFDGNSSGFIRVGSERDGYREWQAHQIEVLVGTSLVLDTIPLTLDGETLFLGS